MPRSGLTKAQVRDTRARLLAEGRYPSVDAVRHALGDCGSKSTIHRYLKELRDEETGGGAPREDTASALHTLVEQLADRLHADADERIRQLRTSHEQALRDKDEELAALRRQVAALEARLAAGLAREDEQVLTVSSNDPLWSLHSQRPALAAGAMRAFGDPSLNSRSGGRGGSQFSLIGAAAR